jgi:coenzyme F420 hydrogenase subunit beta
MRTFDDLIKEVQNPGLCHRCGACVAFCAAINYGALELDSEGQPRYADRDRCIKGGLCYVICPAIDELKEETKRNVDWTAPMGRVSDIRIARAKDPAIRNAATDGGVVTALLVHLFQKRQIDAAVVTKPVGPFKRVSFLAATEEDIRSSAGSFFDISYGMKSLSDHYSTYSQIGTFHSKINNGFHRVAFVGTPCQIQAIRKMQTINIFPSEVVKLCLGLLCSGNFIFGEKQRRKVAQIGNFQWERVNKINIKEKLMVHLKGGEVRKIKLSDLNFMKRFPCNFCDDFSAEYADISFGGLGAGEGWTTVIIRSPIGRKYFSSAASKAIEENEVGRHLQHASKALSRVRHWSDKKKTMALESRKTLGSKFPDPKLEDCSL